MKSSILNTQIIHDAYDFNQAYRLDEQVGHLPAGTLVYSTGVKIGNDSPDVYPAMLVFHKAGNAYELVLEGLMSPVGDIGDLDFRT